MNCGVFLDRDGVITRLVFNPNTGEYESPHHEKDYQLYPHALESLKILGEAGYKLFLVSNQPSYAKGKTTLENIGRIHHRLHQDLISAGIRFEDYYYCYHHPQGIVPEYTRVCRCRKPGTLFLTMAREKTGICLEESWFIGDQDTDIFCGQAKGLRTILIDEPLSINKRGKSKPDYLVSNLREAVGIITGLK